MTELIVEVSRGTIVESMHHGDAAVVDAAGRLLWYVGDPYRVTYARSSAKPWQTVPLIESGAADAFALTDAEIALACASHSGEQVHVEHVLALLGRVGISPEKLQCGAHAPYHAKAYESLLKNGQDVTAVHNNCSGKHTGMLLLAQHLGADLDTYLQPTHPVQQKMLEAVSELTSVAKEDIPIGVDGCGVPVFGLPIIRMAHAYAKMADPSQLNEVRQKTLRRIVKSMTSNPHLVAGSERFCTSLMEAGQGALVGKAGAEGVYCVAVPAAGVGIAVKVNDGNARAAYPTVVEILAQTKLVDSSIIETLSAWRYPEVRNHQGTLVGRMRPVFQVHQAL